MNINKQPNPEDRIFSSELTMQRVNREVKRFEMINRLDEHELRCGLSADTFMDHVARQMVLRLKATVASKKFDVKTVRFPATWWDGFKESAAKWCREHGMRKLATKLAKRVAYIDVTMEANAYHPDIAIPDHATYVDIAIRAKFEGYQ